MNNFLLVGPPRVGKTTIIKKFVAANPALCFQGFYTEEIREHNKRVGFLIRTLDGKKATLAHRNFKSQYRVGPYGVDVKNVDEIATSAIVSQDDNALIIIDEIGKMECYSERFRHTVWQALDSSRSVIGTIAVLNEGFYRKVKARSDVELITVTHKNRNLVVDELTSRLGR